MERSSAIDAWRAIAALGVAAFHGREILWVGIRQYTAQIGAPDSLEAFIAYSTLPLVFGGMGVPIFFVLSGYCIHLAHARKLSASPAYTIDIGGFITRRGLRLYPPMMLAIAVTLVLDSTSAVFVPGHTKLGDTSALTMLINLLTLQNLSGPNFGSNVALWTLSVEIHLYLAYLALFSVRRRFGLPAVIALVMTINAISVWLTSGKSLVLFTNYLLIWWAGAIVAELNWHAPRPQKLLATAGVSVFSAGCAAHLMQMTLTSLTLCGLGFALLLGPSIASTRLQCRVLKWLAKVGEFSYSIYLVHVPFFVFVSAAVYGGAKQLSIFPALLFSVFAVLFAYGCFLVAEKPALAALRELRPRHPVASR